VDEVLKRLSFLVYVLYKENNCSRCLE